MRILCVVLAGCGTAGTVGITSVSTALYTRVDGNRTTVWAPRTSLVAKVGERGSLQASVAIDAWTSASIDITTAATGAVHEVREEVNAGGSYQFEKVLVSANYRYSIENDYWSNGGVLTTSVDLANKNTTLAGSIFGSSDVVGRAGDPYFLKPQQTLGGRFSLTQVVDKSSVAQASIESAGVSGYQAGPYRFVALAGDGTCYGSAPYCVPEVVPSMRHRNALVGRYRRAFGEHVSLGAEYRFYVDDWGVLSHTIVPELSVLVGEHGMLSFTYRYYTQGEADFYRPRYVNEVNTPRYVTRDRELSAFYYHRVGAGYVQEFDISERGALMTLALRTGVARFEYLAFVGLETVDALEATAMWSLTWL